MKHLRKFNEGKAPDQSEIYDLSRDYLAYLIDDDYSCDIHTAYEWSNTAEKITSKLVTNIVLSKYKDKYKGINGEFLWNECKDHFIPFIHLLSKDYNIDNFNFMYKDKLLGLQPGSAVPVLRSTKRSLQQVLDDDNCNFESLQRVTVVISKKE